MSQTPIVIVQGGTPGYVNSNGTQPSVIYVQQAQGSAAPAEDFGRFGKQLNRRLTKVMGDLMIVCGILALIGDSLETVAYAIEYSNLPSYLTGSYSLIYYAGYWCGCLIVASGSVAVHSSKNPSNCMVITDLVAAGVGTVFAIVLLALCADKMTLIIDAQNACNSLPWPYTCGSFVPLMLSGYSCMLAAGSLAIVFGGILAVFTAIAFIKGLARGNDVQASP